MLILTQRLPPNSAASVYATLALTAEDRARSRHRVTMPSGEAVYLNLPRGTWLRQDDLLQGQTEAGDAEVLVRVVAKPEPVLTVTAAQPFNLLRAAYHLGNRHVALELAPAYLRLAPDPVLVEMLTQLGLTVTQEIAPFEPEAGAYGASHPTGAHPHSAVH